MAIADKLTYLNATKLLLRDAIRRAGHYLPDAATFRSYPSAMLPDEASLKLDFVRGEYVAHNWRDGTVSRSGLSNIMTTTRASGGGYFDHLGVYQWAADNVPRIDHDPATLSTSSSSVTMAAGAVTLAVSHLYPVGSYVRATHDGSNWMAGRVTASTGSSVTLWVDRVVGSGTYASWTLIRVSGLLVEESRTNLLTYSSDFANAVWARTNVNVESVSGGGYKISPISSGTTFTRMQQALIGAASPGRVNTVSFDVEADGWRYIQIHGGGNEYGNVHANFDLLTGQFSASGVTAWVRRVSASIWRISATFTAGASGTDGTATICFVPSLASGRGAAPTGADGVLGVVVHRADNQLGALPASHIPTTTAQVTRAADQCSISNLTDWLGTDRTLIIEHNAPSGRVLLSSGATVLATSQGPGKLAIVCTATETRICQAGGSVTTSGPLTFDTSLRLLASASAYANAHVSVVQSIPRALSNTELQRITA